MTKVRWGLCATSVATLVLATVGCSSDADDCNFVRTCGGPVGGGGGADAGTPETGGASGASGSGSGGASGASGSGGTSGSGGASGAGGTAGASGARDAGPDVMDAPPACDPTKTPGETACVVDEQYGVFVSPSGNDSSGDGTREHPYQTLAKGLTAAKDATKRVYVCADGGSYGESVATTPDGAAVFAGFHCADWTWDDALRAKVESPGAIAWKIDSAQTGAVLQNLEIVAANAVGAGTSSIGVFVNASQNVALRHLKITAGNGAPGQGGTSIGGSAA
ncbi:MAG TPA: hypothetical protein VHE30_05745, partial [Polyangiaceae bacterium]|nr:hypothetical protein [Polyangiaceae bacterium]